jgi:hypothetical protein
MFVIDLSGQVQRLHLQWPLARWRSVLFTDESRFQLYRANGVMRASCLLMSTLWTECPMGAVGLWYGQAQATDNEHNCILSRTIWMHRDTVTRSWGPLSCYHLMFQHDNTWSHVAKICTLFLEVENGLYTHQTFHTLSHLGMLWIDVYNSVFQFPLLRRCIS